MAEPTKAEVLARIDAELAEYEPFVTSAEKLAVSLLRVAREDVKAEEEHGDPNNFFDHEFVKHALLDGVCGKCGKMLPNKAHHARLGPRTRRWAKALGMLEGDRD